MKTGNKALSLLLAILLVFGTAFTALAVDGGEPEGTTIKAADMDGKVVLEYKETKSFYFEAQNVPQGASVHVFRNGEDCGEDTYICVKNPTEDFTVEGKVLDADGNVIAASGEIKVTVKNGILDRVRAFFRDTFGTAADAAGDFLGAIFMKILVFLNGGRFMK